MRKRLTILSIIFLAFAVSIPAYAQNVDLGVSIGSEGLRGFYLGVSNYYRVPEREVVVVHDRGIPHDEIPVAFFIATRAHVAPGIIVDLRLGGMSWWDISMRYGIGPEVYYIPTTVVVKNPPYGRAYGYYRKYPRDQWRTKVVLRDADVVNFVNLRYVSEHYDIPPDRVIDRRTRGEKFSAIDREYDRQTKGKHRYAMDEGRHGKKDKSEWKHDREQEKKKDKGKSGKSRDWTDDIDRGKGGKSKDKDWTNDIERGKGGKSDKDWKHDSGKGKGKGKGGDD
jgi:hypothetical protein